MSLTLLRADLVSFLSGQAALQLGTAAQRVPAVLSPGIGLSPVEKGCCESPCVDLPDARGPFWRVLVCEREGDPANDSPAGCTELDGTGRAPAGPSLPTAGTFLFPFSFEPFWWVRGGVISCFNLPFPGG